MRSLRKWKCVKMRLFWCFNYYFFVSENQLHNSSMVMFYSSLQLYSEQLSTLIEYSTSDEITLTSFTQLLGKTKYIIIPF